MKKIVWIFIGAVALGNPLRAEGVLSLKDALSIAERENPEVAAAQGRWKAARARVSQKATPDKPRLDFERMYAPRGQDLISDANEKNVAITQELPFPTTLFYAGRQAALEARAEEARLRGVEIDVAARVKVAYAVLAQTHHHRHIMEENVALMQQFSRSVESKYATGRATQAEALKANLELARMENEVVDRTQEEETAKALLNLLLNRSPEADLQIAELGAPNPLTKSFDELVQEAAANRPEIKAAEAELKSEQAGQTAARSNFLPDLMLQYRRRDMADGEKSQDGIVGLSLPLWFWKQGAEVREASAMAASAEAEQKLTSNMTGYEIKEALTKLKSALRMVQLYEKAMIPQAQQARRSAESAYQGGRGSFLDLLDATRTVLSFQQDYYHAMTDSWKALAQLERLVGSDLQEVQQ